MKQDMNADDRPATSGDVKTIVQEIVGASMAAFRLEMRDMFRPIVATLAQHTEQLAEIRGEIRTKLVTRDEFHSRMDAISRLAKLEKRPS